MPRGITQEQVSQAADAIVAVGERPTVERIRQRLGTGSPNTVTRMLDGWRQGLAERLRQASVLPELPDGVGQAMTALWSQALQHAQTQAQQALQAEHDVLQRAAADLDARASEQVTQLAAAEADKAKSLELARLAETKVEAQQQLVDRFQSELRSRGQELERLMAQNQKLVAAEFQLRQEIQATGLLAIQERERCQQHVHSVENRAHAQVDQTREDLKTTRAELAETRKQLRDDQRVQQQRIAELTRALSIAEREASHQRGVAEALALKLSLGSNAGKTQRKRPTKAVRPRSRQASSQ